MKKQLQSIKFLKTKITNPHFDEFQIATTVGNSVHETMGFLPNKNENFKIGKVVEIYGKGIQKEAKGKWLLTEKRGRLWILHRWK